MCNSLISFHSSLLLFLIVSLFHLLPSMLTFVGLHTVPMMNHHTMPKFGFGPYKKTGVGSFYLPKILTTGTGCSGKVALELSHGKSKQLISLPSEKLDSNKRYFVTFTVKETEKQQQQQQQHQHGATNCEAASVQCSSTSEQKQ